MWVTAGAGRTVSYFSFNMASVIQQGSVSTTLHYDTEHQRFTSAPNANSFTYYLNDPASGSMSELLETSTTATWHDFVLAEGRIVAERFLPNGGSATWNYFVGDHLGSTSVVTDASGNVLERDSYDAWGMRRCPNATAGCLTGSVTTRGFTAQEEIDSLGLVNLNARVYDPQIGRFMTADSMVPYPLDGQSYNRFSYVENNPLAFIDPSGHADLCSEDGPGACKTLVTGYTNTACFGCSGQGWTTDAAGNLATAASQGFESISIGISGLDGVTQTVSIDFRASDLSAFLSEGGISTGASFGGGGDGGAMGGAANESGSFASGAANSGGGMSDGQIANNGTGSSQSTDGPIETVEVDAEREYVDNGGFQRTAWNWQTLDYTNLFSSRDGAWMIKWSLSQKSSKGGWIVQHIIANFAGVKYNYWEAWQVSAGDQTTVTLSGFGYDDMFNGPSGSQIQASASFYEGLTLPDSFGVQPSPFPAGILPATTTDPQLSVDQATAAVNRSWHH
jgi:RHS repeat-associated protein